VHAPFAQSAADTPIIEACDIAFAYPDATSIRTLANLVVRNVSCQIFPGTVTAILGPNGAGKSTLLRLLAGLLTPSKGHILIHGKPLESLGLRARARTLAYVAQRPDMAFAFSVREVVALGRYASGDAVAPAGAAAIAYALAKFDLTRHANDPFATLSAGQQQRVSLARAAAQLYVDPHIHDKIPLSNHSRHVLLCDEPVAAMDPRYALSSMQILRETSAGGAAVVVVLHDVALALAIASHVILLACDGSVAASGPTNSVLTAQNLEKLFGIPFLPLLAQGDHPGTPPRSLIPYSLIPNNQISTSPNLNKPSKPNTPVQ